MQFMVLENIRIKASQALSKTQMMTAEQLFRR